MSQTKDTDHEPVLLAQVLQYLNPHPGEIYLDVTAGYGGHAKEILARTIATAVLVDRDQNAIDYFDQDSRLLSLRVLMNRRYYISWLLL